MINRKLYFFTYSRPSRLFLLWLIYTLIGILLLSISGSSLLQDVEVAFLVFLVIFSYEPLIIILKQLYLKVFRSSYLAREQILLDLEKEMTINTPYNLLIQRFLVNLARVFQAKRLVIFIERENGYTLQGSIGFSHYLANKLSFLSNHPLIEAFGNEHEPFGIEENLVEDFLKEISNGEQIEERLYGVPLKSNQHLLGGIIVSNLPYDISRYWRSREIYKVIERFALILDNANLYNTLEQEIQHKEILLSLNRKISAQIHLDDILETLITELKRIMPYDAAGIFIRGSTAEKLKYLKVKGYDESRLSQVRLKAGHGIVNWCMAHGIPRIVPDTTTELLYFPIRESTRSEICVPIKGSEGIIGALNLESDNTGYYTNEDLDLLLSISDLASIAIQNARLLNEALEKREVMNDIEVAAEIQRAIMPRNIPEIPGFDINAVSIPSKVISGDFYDFVRFSSGQFGLTIGDVSGKGIPASLLMATIFAFYRNGIRSGKSLSDIFAGLNNDLYQATSSDRFTTLFYCQIKPENLELHYVNAGHNPPFILHQDGTLSFLETGGPLLGVIPDATYQEGSLHLKPGDLLVMYTDGVTEAFNDLGEEYGEKRLIKLLSEAEALSAKQITEKILMSVKEFSALEQFMDDLTMVIMRVNPAALYDDKSLDK